MAPLKHLSLIGSHLHRPTGSRYDYDVEARVALDRHGRESLRMRVIVSRGAASNAFTVVGQAEPGDSFVGREERLALDCVALACARFPAAAVLEPA